MTKGTAASGHISGGPEKGRAIISGRRSLPSHEPASIGGRRMRIGSSRNGPLLSSESLSRKALASRGDSSLSSLLPLRRRK